MNSAFHSDEITHGVPQRLARRTAASVAGVYNASTVNALFQLADAIFNLHFWTTFSIGPADAVSENSVTREANILLLRVVAHGAGRMTRSVNDFKVGNT